MKVIAIYPGRFQPFHLGHKSVYDVLVRQFGVENVYIATSDKVDPPRSPFNFAEKQQIIAATGVDRNRVVQTRDPYKAIEITSQYDPRDTKLLFAVSAKDMAEDPRFKSWTKRDGSPAYFQPAPNKVSEMEDFDKHGYIFVVPTLDFKVDGKPMRSATEFRKEFAAADEATKAKMTRGILGTDDPSLVKLLASRITEGKKMKLNDVVNETTAGAIGSVVAPLGATQRRKVKEVDSNKKPTPGDVLDHARRAREHTGQKPIKEYKEVNQPTDGELLLLMRKYRMAKVTGKPIASVMRQSDIYKLVDAEKSGRLEKLKYQTTVEAKDPAQQAAPKTGDTFTTSKGGTVTRTARGLKHTRSPDAGKDINPGSPSKVSLDRYKLHSQPRSMFSGDLSEAAETGLFPTNAAPIRVGSTGDLVKAWQWTLSKLGLNTAVDGKFGNGTKQNTIEFQQSNSLPADGTVGSSTYSTANSVLQDKGITNNPFLQGVKAAVQRGYAKIAGALPNMPVAKTVFDFFKSKGYNDIQAAAFVGNFAHESGFSGSALNPNDAGSPSFGLAQWKLDRLEALKKFAAQQGTSFTDLGTQLNFVINELGRSHARANAALQATPNDLAGAVKAIQGKYEVGANYEPRFKYAQIALQQFAPETFASMTSQTPVSESTGQQLGVEQLATISDEALDRAYHYGRSSPGNTFGWQANLKSAAFAKKIIDSGVADIEKISDAIHRGWNVTAQAFVKDPMRFDDSKTMAPEKLQAKLAQRKKLMTQKYAQLPEDEKEKDRVVARALLQAITGEQGVAEDNLKEFAPGNGGGESGRWYTDDQMTDLVGDGWWNDLDISGDISKQEMIQEAQAWLDDQGYSVHVLNCKVNDDDMEWYIEGSFQNSRFAKKGVAEGGPFSYGKPPRKGSVADLAAQKRKEQDKKTPPIEPRDQMVGTAKVTKDVKEEWSQKYKNSINCKHPKGFSQKAHCAGKRKHTESTVMEMTCPDCGMCKSHGTLSEIRKGQKDANGYTKCWPGKHAEGTKKGKNGGQVRNCVPNKSVSESFHDSVTFEIDSENAFNHVMGRFNSRIDWNGEYMVAPRQYWGAIQELAHEAGGAATEISDEHSVAEDMRTKADFRREIDSTVADFLSRGGEIETVPPNRVRVKPGQSLASKHIGSKRETGRIVGKDRRVHGNKPVVNVSEVNDYFKRRKDEEDRIAGVKPPAKNKKDPAKTDYQQRRNREQQVGEAKQKPSAQQRFNQRLKTKHGIDLDAMERQWAERTKKIEAEIAALRKQEQKVSESYYQTNEDWRTAVAGAALAGAAALGSGGAQAQTADFHTPLTQPTVQQTRADYVNKLPQVDSVERNGDQVSITHDGKEYQGVILQPNDPRPRFGPGTVQAQVAASELGIRGLGSYVVYFVNNRAYIEMR